MQGSTHVSEIDSLLVVFPRTQEFDRLFTFQFP